MWTAENTYQTIEQILYFGGGAHPLHPPPGSAPEYLVLFADHDTSQLIMCR